MFHAFRCVFTLLQCCVLIVLDWAEPMMYLNLHITCSSILMQTYLHFFTFLYATVLILSWLSLSLSLSFLCQSALWHLNINLLCPRALYILRHLLPLTLHLLLFSSMMMKLKRTSQRTSVDKAFIRNAKSFCRTFLTLTYSLSFIVGFRSHLMTSQSLVPLWSYRSFIPIRTESILQYLISSIAFAVHAL